MRESMTKLVCVFRRVGFAGLLVGLFGVAGGLGLGACSGSSEAGSSLGAACRDASPLCVTSCSLGCVSGGSCSLARIAENQPISFSFSQEIDPDSVTTATLTVIGDNGVPASGTRLVQGNRVDFLPQIDISGGQAAFGFEKGRSYTIRLAGSDESPIAIRSVSGGALATSRVCTVIADLGVIDVDQKPPEAKLILPTKTTAVIETTLIVLEFSEVIDTSIFQGGGAGTGIVYTVALADPGSGDCAGSELNLPGIVSVNVDQRANVSSVVFRPSILLPSQACVRVRVTKDVTDLSGKSAIPIDFEFSVRKRAATEQSILEDFSSTTMLEPLLSGADWGRTKGGILAPGRLGGSGELGEFKATFGRDLQQKDAQGRDIYEWNTNTMTFTQTLSGQPITVTDGVFEFTTLIVKDTERIRLIGAKPARFFATGTIQIEGVIEMLVPAPAKSSKPKLNGAPGGPGICGGARGGAGGDALSVTGGSVHGRQGGGVVLRAGHPRASLAKATGGGGASAHPASGKAADVVWIIDTGFKVYSRQVAAGGGGGGFWNPAGGSFKATGGAANKTVASPPFWPYAAKSAEFGPPSKAGANFPVAFASLPAVPSTTLFLIGGSGGGGGGLQPLYSTTGTVVWSAGSGGAGGGGALNFQAGSDLILGSKAEILAKGGTARDIVKDVGSSGLFQPPTPSGAGGGSGGSVLFQAGRLASVVGSVDVSGGLGGSYSEKRTISPLLYVETVGGNGGPGYIRVESDPAPKHTSMPRFKPASTTENVALLRPVDYSANSVAGSKWYSTETLLPPTFLYYVIDAEVDGVTKTYSDNPAKYPGSVPATSGQAVVLLVQSAQVSSTKPRVRLSDPTDWVEGSVKPLNSVKYKGKAGNGIRFMMRLDRTKTVGGKGNLKVKSIKVVFVG